MAWIIGKKSDDSLIEISIKLPDFSLEELETIIPGNYGGSASDYTFYQMDAVETERIKSGDEYDLEWDNHEITGIDFAAEDVKRWVKIYADKTEIDGDGSDTANITLEVWKADLSAIDTNVNVTGKSLPILTPDGERIVKINISGGVASRAFKTTKAGKWIFPGRGKGYENVRFVGTPLQIVVRDINIWN